MNLAGEPDTRSTPAELAGRRAVVMGLGSFGGGLGAARYLARRGAAVLVTDLRPEPQLVEARRALAGLPVRTVLGGHRREDFERAELVVANPAVPPDHPLLELARAHGARVTSEIELFLEAVRARIACVTGTQGKSSTCHVLHQCLLEAGMRAHLGGNIGGSLLDDLERIEPGDVVVLELSSYQLAALEDPARLGHRVERVEAVAITNVLCDHLERHGSAEDYAAAKRRILELPRDGVALLPEDDARTAGWAAPRARRVGFRVSQAAACEPAPGRTARGEAELVIREGEFRLAGEALGRVADLRLPGGFQRDNVLVALGLARSLGADARRLARAVPRLRGLEHRLEPLGSFGGHPVHDNGVSTTPDSTVSALRALAPGTCLVLGGRLKRLPLDELAAVAAERVSRAVCFGEARDRLAGVLRAAGVDAVAVERLEAAVRHALDHAPPGADVLFSPACASFDAFSNFRERARAFRAALPSPDA